MGTTTITTTSTTTSTTTDMDGAATELFDLMSWMSPAWPVGAFAHSSGLEWAVDQGLATDRASTVRWISAMLDHGSLHNDVVVFVYAWRAVLSEDEVAFIEIAELAAAVQSSHERRVESCAQGAAFRRIALSAEESSRFGGFLSGIADDELTYPVACAALFGCRGISLRSGLTAFLHGCVSNLVSAAQRLVPLGQTDGQLVLRELRAPVFALVETGCSFPEDDPFAAIGGCTLMADIGCMAHETQYTRLFRT